MVEFQVTEKIHGMYYSKDMKINLPTKFTAKGCVWDEILDDGPQFCEHQRFEINYSKIM
jgi:hypothetical protein